MGDDHAVVLDALTHVIQRDFDIAGIAHDGWQLVELAKKVRPDVVITDISMPQLNGLDAARIIRKEVDSARLLFLTMHADLAMVEEAFRTGASGYILKICGLDELIKAIQFVARGATYITSLVSGDLISTLATAGPQHIGHRTRLTLRQREVLQLLAEGKTMKEVGAVLGISTRTAESHKYEIMRELGVKTTAALVRYAVNIKLV